MIRRLLAALSTATMLISPAYAFQAGDIVAYSDTTGGKVQSNTTLVPVFTNTQMNLYAASLLNSIVPGTEYSGSFAGNFATEGLTGGVAVGSGSTVYQANGVAGYVDASSTTTNTVAVFGLAKAKAASTKIWGSNFVAETGNNAITTAVVQELDANNFNASAAVFNGLSILGGSTQQPIAGNAISIGAMGTGIKWPTAGIFIGDGAAANGMVIGQTAASGASLGSQGLFFHYTNGSSVQNSYSIATDTTQALLIVNGSGSGAANVVFDGQATVNAPHGTAAILNFGDARTTKYQWFRDATTDNFVGEDNGVSGGPLAFLTIASGTLTLGETGKTVNLVGTIQAGGTSGVSCAANSVSLTTEVVTNGLVTHC